jgi:hypothetical protein
MISMVLRLRVVMHGNAESQSWFAHRVVCSLKTEPDF